MPSHILLVKVAVGLPIIALAYDVITRVAWSVVLHN